MGWSTPKLNIQFFKKQLVTAFNNKILLVTMGRNVDTEAGVSMLVTLPLKSAEVEEENVKKPMVLLDLAPRQS